MVPYTTTGRLENEKVVALGPAPKPALNKIPKYGALYIFIVFLVVLIAYAAGYYFSYKQHVHAKRTTLLSQKIALHAQIDKQVQILNQASQVQKAPDNSQRELDKKDAAQSITEPVTQTGSKTVAPPVSHLAIEKKFIVPLLQETAVRVPEYCVSVASCKLKESADVVIKDLQKKGYEPAVDNVTLKDTAWYRVTLGHFQTKGEARNYARELQSKENIRGDILEKK